MTRRQIRATFVLAACIAVAGIVAAIVGGRRTIAIEPDIEVGVIAPQPLDADTASDAGDGAAAKVKKKKKERSQPAEAADHRDSPLYHETPRSDI